MMAEMKQDFLIFKFFKTECHLKDEPMTVWGMTLTRLINPFAKESNSIKSESETKESESDTSESEPNTNESESESDDTDNDQELEKETNENSNENSSYQCVLS